MTAIITTEGDIEAYVVKKEGYVVVSFRGTEASHVSDYQGWEKFKGGIKIRVPVEVATNPPSKYAWVFKLENVR